MSEIKNVVYKTYPDGSIGQYWSLCNNCKEPFIGHKLDPWCSEQCETQDKIKNRVRKRSERAWEGFSAVLGGEEG